MFEGKSAQTVAHFLPLGRNRKQPSLFNHSTPIGPWDFCHVTPSSFLSSKVSNSSSATRSAHFSSPHLGFLLVYKQCTKSSPLNPLFHIPNGRVDASPCHLSFFCISYETQSLNEYDYCCSPSLFPIFFAGSIHKWESRTLTFHFLCFLKETRFYPGDYGIFSILCMGSRVLSFICHLLYYHHQSQVIFVRKRVFSNVLAVELINYHSIVQQ